MIQIQGLHFPDDVGHRWEHAFQHVKSIEVGLSYCTSKRTAVQAGGNVGLWPRRLAKEFVTVWTFEPDRMLLPCLRLNVPHNVVVSCAALGRSWGVCGWMHKGLGSHRVVEGGDAIQIITLDSFGIDDLDFLQLDIEGYEANAIEGAIETIKRCHPVIQVELRGYTERYGSSDAAVRECLASLGYRQVATAKGSDFIFRWGGA